MQKFKKRKGGGAEILESRKKVNELYNENVYVPSVDGVTVGTEVEVVVRGKVTGVREADEWGLPYVILELSEGEVKPLGNKFSELADED